MRLLTRLVDGKRRFLRWRGKLARNSQACRDRCCGERRFVKFTDCCDPRNYSWWEVGPITHPDDSTRMLLRVGTPPLQCFVSDPARVLTFSEVVALGDAGRITPGQPDPKDIEPGECTAEDCPACRCCSSGLIRRCNVPPFTPPTCCSCGSVFRFTFQSRIRLLRTIRFVGGAGTLACIGSSCRDPCSGALVPSFCYAPMSSEETERFATRNVTISLRFECDNQNHWTVTCLQFGIDSRGQTNGWLGWNPNDPVNWPNPCPPGEGYTPKFVNAIGDPTCAGSGCDFLDQINGFPPYRDCQPFPLPGPFDACSLDLFNFRALAGTLGSEVFDYLDPAWMSEYYAKCSGERQHTGPARTGPFSFGCNRSDPGEVRRLTWFHDIRCGRGEIRDSVELQHIGTGGGLMNTFYNIDAAWTVVQEIPCQGDDPCDDPPDPFPDVDPFPVPVVTDGPITFDSSPGTPKHVPQPKAVPLSAESLL